MKKATVLLLSTIVVASLSACGGNNNNNATSPSPTTGTEAPAAQAADVDAIYKTNCISCHGAYLEGKMGGNTNLQHVGADMSKEQIADQIANGGGGMMAFKGKLSDDEINALADWLAAKK